MRFPFRYNRRKRAGSCETIRKKFMYTPAARVRTCHGSINARAIKIKGRASFLLPALLRPVQILRKTHEPNRPLIERLHGAKGKSAIIRVRELKLCDRERRRKKNPIGLWKKKKIRRKIKSGFPCDQGNCGVTEEIDLTRRIFTDPVI